VEATAEVTSASVENLSFVAQGSADVAFTLADTAFDAVQGRGRFPRPLPLRALAVLYTNATHIVVAADAPIRALGDLRGRRVSLGAPNSGTEVIAERVLRAAGLDPGEDVTRERLGFGESVAALKDGRIDAFFASAGVPTAAVLDAAATPGFEVRLLSDAHLVERLVAEHGPLYSSATIPDGAYPGVPSVEVSAVRNLLVVREDMPADLAYAITRTLFEKRVELSAAHPAARELSARTGAASAVMEYHSGAARYYEEVGVWKSRELRP
ncbi:MAG TPA: TAXI family TRAP transporter solute-binding subunit, partial [Vicinamibacteria bacterium]|nr:TAXI family TRAP transporter solute-binding subunit [Vicinamibacteria bacterium]